MGIGDRVFSNGDRVLILSGGCERKKIEGIHSTGRVSYLWSATVNPLQDFVCTNPRYPQTNDLKTALLFYKSGTVTHLSGFHRTEIAPFTVDDAMSMEEFEKMMRWGVRI
jgi:hypothetical protein